MVRSGSAKKDSHDTLRVKNVPKVFRRHVELYRKEDIMLRWKQRNVLSGGVFKSTTMGYI